jgi:hypothetical protein
MTTKTTYLLHLQRDNYYFDSIVELRHFMLGKGLAPCISISNITSTLDLVIVEVYPVYI